MIKLNRIITLVEVTKDQFEEKDLIKDLIDEPDVVEDSIRANIEGARDALKLTLSHLTRVRTQSRLNAFRRYQVEDEELPEEELERAMQAVLVANGHPPAS